MATLASAINNQVDDGTEDQDQQQPKKVSLKDAMSGDADDTDEEDNTQQDNTINTPAAEAKPKLLTPKQAADRTKLMTLNTDSVSSAKSPGVAQPGQEKESVEDIVTRHMDKLDSMFGKISEKYQNQYQNLAKQIDAAIEEKKGTRDQAAWLQLAAQLTNNLVAAGSAMYGMKHNVNMSGYAVQPAQMSSLIQGKIDDIDDKIKNMQQQQGLLGTQQKEETGLLMERGKMETEAAVNEAKQKAAEAREDTRLLQQQQENEKNRQNQINLELMREKSRQGLAAGKSQLSPGQKKMDEEFGKNYAELIKGGGSKSDMAVNTLTQAIDRLEKTQGDIFGATGAVSLIPKSIRDRVGAESSQIEDDVNSVIQNNLRPILGAQFTQKEGENLLKRTFNPAQPVEANIVRLRRLVSEMKSAAQANSEAAKYFKENGTLSGYDGKIYQSSDDFNVEGDSTKQPTQSVPTATSQDIQKYADKHNSDFNSVKQLFIKRGYKISE